MKRLIKRTLTGLGLATGLFGFVLLTGWVSSDGVLIGQYFFDALVLAFSAFATYEMIAVSKKSGYNPSIIPICVFFAAVYPMLTFFGINGYFITAGAAFILEFCFFIFDSKVKINDFLITILITIYPLMLLTLIIYLTESYGMIPMLVAIAAAMVSDTLAFYMGSLIKGKKIFPKISPSKTYSGCAFGIVGGVLGALLVYALFEVANLPVNDVYRFTEQVANPILAYCLLGAAIAVISEIGDLAASRLKREFGVKDFSNVLGTHGGIIDRLDSVMFAVLFMSIIMAFIA